MRVLQFFITYIDVFSGLGPLYEVNVNMSRNEDKEKYMIIK